ncbi:MAG: DUF1190 domain-containing protein [Gammaproteobacteria bacterium]|nr:DUF1190 domain-containing protein [Gammaproteobacteria bacterium]MBU2059584.1 DUF1190 domain-containing protein [Gammaproteobacteria bacterium]MBU2174431.1 DUF1190 domain-containing protein [Gammaproteobacteria bacterium]MBU2248056.1 DUF1190 domain-containing protein [Gammaproteobacteria bacterium]MBU2345526.1 DUF1190 domain-containing protein [Gammaproteobacteria bacterium]
MKQKVLKRSKKAALVLMVPTATFLMAGCGQEEAVQTAAFETVDQCAAYYNPEQCKADLGQALTMHTQVAPKYTDKAACETDFGVGQCETPAQAATAAGTEPPAQASSGGFFMPMMMGFLAGQMLNRSGGQLKQPVQAQPLYKSRDDRSTFRTATNTPVARGVGSTYIKPSSVQPKPAGMVNRGGFGAQAAKRSSSSSSFGG